MQFLVESYFTLSKSLPPLLGETSIIVFLRGELSDVASYTYNNAKHTILVTPITKQQTKN